MSHRWLAQVKTAILLPKCVKYDFICLCKIAAIRSEIIDTINLIDKH
jgi:hypothetical protein